MTTQSTKTVIITGANGGMGVACAAYFHEQGWHVLAIDRSHTDLQFLADSDRFTAMRADLRDDALVDQVAQALSALPAPLGLINLAGKSIGDSIDKLTEDDWQDSFAINVTPAMRLIQLIAPLMAKAGGGSIVNVGSPVGIVGARKASYAASKAALHGLTMSCAQHLGKDNIRVNLVLPGPTITKMTADWPEDKRQAIASNSFLKRLCTVEEMAKTLGFLLGPDSTYLTGSVVDLTAGTMYGH